MLHNMQFHTAFTTSYLFAFLMGLASSLHCIGMCGSIIGTLTLSLSPDIRNNKKRLLPYVFNYNLGRIISYTTAGGIIGFASTLIADIPAFGGYRLLQLLSALVMAGAGLYIAGWFPHFAYIEKAGLHIWRRLEPLARKLIPIKTRSRAFLFGLLWGWLPCGLIYSALALASTTGNPQQSALTMLFFGLGTLPAVMGVGIMTGILTKLSSMRRFKQAIGLFMILLALLAAMPWLNPMALVTSSPHTGLH
jgi:uncharacterized protein